MAAEWRAHLDAHADALVAAGMSPADASRRARTDFGDPLRWKEQAFEVRGAGWVTDLGADVRYGLRQMRRAPVFTAAVLVTLAAGIGLNTAVFSVIDAVLVRSLSYPDPERVLWVTTVDRDQEFVTALDYLAWKEQATSFDGLVAFETSDYAIYTADNVVQSRITWVSEDFWTVSDGRPMLGRLPQRGEDAILLSHAFFVRAFGADPAVVGGRAVTVSGRQVTIAGVLAPGFRAQMTRPHWAGRPEAAIDAYRTLTVRPPTNGQMRLISVIGKLKAGVSVERAQAELGAIRSRTRTTNPNMPLPPTLRLMPLKEKIVGDATRPLIVLLAAAGFVFLIACANVANLFLARASARRTEVAIRAAIGAGRWRLARQFFVESALIATAGAVAGLVVAKWSLATIVRILPDAVPRLQETTIDGRALAFAAATAIVAAVVFGMVPVWSLWKDDARGVLKQALSKQALSGALPIAGKLRTKTALVALEFALTIVLLIGAGLLIKSLWRLNALPEGFHPDRIVTMQIQFSGPAYREDARRAHAAEVLRRVSTVPGVRAVAVTTNADFSLRLVREGDPFPPRPDDPPAFALGTIASADLAKVMGMRLVRGRWLTDFESSPAFVINETLARRHFGDSDPLGARFRVPTVERELWATVVGVVADTKLQRLDAPAEPEFYVDYAHLLTFHYSIVASVTTDAAAAAAEVRRSAAGVDPAVPVLDVRTLEAALADSIAPYRFNLFTFGLFAAVALLLASVGIYGTLAYSTSRRTQEIGVRLALGAARGEVVTMVIRQGMTVALIGTLAGLLIGVAVARVMRGLLYEVSPGDPYIFAAASAVLLLAGFAASLGPALRAASVQPLVALRHE